MAKRPQWYRPDVQLTFRMALTMFLLLAVYTGFIVLLWGLTHGSIVLFIGLAAILLLVQFGFSDKIALWSMNAREVSPQEAPELHSMLDRLAQQTNLPKPTLYIAQTSVPNAFATGRDQKHAIVCVTSGIVNRLNPQEMEAVLAHEMTHIINRDMLIMTVAMFFSMLALLLMRIFMWDAILGGGGGGFGGRRGGRDNSGASIAIIGLLLSAVTAAVSFVLVRTLSRYREYAADRGSALITGAPLNLASALMKITDSVQSGRIPNRDLRQSQTVGALGIAPLNLNGDDLGELFSDHPSTAHRVERLQAMQAQMEAAPRVH